MLYTFLVILLILDSIVLVTAILLQSGKGGGLAASFGGATSAADALIGTRQAGNLLTKASWWCGGIFLLLAFVLQIASTRTRVPASVLDKPLTTVPAAPAPTTTQKANPAVPLEAAPKNAPAATTPATPAPTTPAPKGTQPKQ
jgi:preprotein translocase subunit SecG